MSFDENIETIERIIGYHFRDPSLLKQAFTRTSYCNEENRRRKVKLQSSEVLEFIGDGALSTAIITLLMADESQRYEFGLLTKLNEGDFSNIKSRLSNKQNLAISTERLGLQKYLIMGEGDERLGIDHQPSVMEDLFESIIGAIYVDSNMSIAPVIESVKKMLDVSVYKNADNETLPISQSAKNELQEWCADKQRRLPPPIYETLSESGPDHKKSFVRGCYIGEKLYGTGEGKNRKLADAAAAKAALTRLMAEATDRDTDAPYVEELRLLAAEMHAAPPSYTDLGETDRSTSTEREYATECNFLGKSSKGVGKSKKEAKAISAKVMLSMLKRK